MGKCYHLLVVGDIYDNHIVRYVKYLKTQNPSITLDVISVKQNKPISPVVEESVNSIFFFEPHTLPYRFIHILQFVHQFNKFLKDISKSHHYDIVNIHFPIAEYYYSMKYLRKLAPKILLTPWGSDVYRINNRRKRVLKHLYADADYVCCTNNRFGKDVRKIFNLHEDKIVNLDIGSETIDFIAENKDLITPTSARQQLNISGSYFITCGYNGHRVQRHLQIIDAISKIRTQFPKDLTLLFPMTYPKDPEYLEEIQQSVVEKNFKACYFIDYLDVEKLFYLRQATDMFIHVQTTDANAASVQEYLLLGKNVVNGSWLRYMELEKNGNIPYHTVDSMNCLPEAILNAYKKGTMPLDNQTKDYIESYGWKKWIVKWNDFFEHIV